ncbi:hypothetical protein QAD02_021345 [Eretmocerus hayati]|uniref:Uncharacterized protein n=1 Tax=Eretmocerus hayati TaxID=131215 RepID=A0ACC2PQ69_9HYME|nr:hypothetical protein QAD02_021345 [Eretmocerus hayati]
MTEGNFVTEFDGEETEDLQPFFTHCTKGSGKFHFINSKIIVGRNVYFTRDEAHSQVLASFAMKLDLVSVFEVTCGRITEDGLYRLVKLDCSQIFMNNADLLARLSKQPSKSIYNRTPKQIIDSMPERNARAFYAFNATTEGLMHSILDESPVMKKSLIALGAHPAIDVMPRINTEMLYFGGLDPLSEFHTEDHHLASVSVMYFNLPPNSQDTVGKVWLIITDEQKLYTVLLEILGDKAATDTADSCQNSGCSGCPFPLDEKNLYLTTEILDNRGIAYNIIVQKPGDVLYLSYGTIHQVTQLTPNCTGAINFADKFWAALAPHKSHC